MNKNYLLSPILALLLFSGCDSSSDSNDKEEVVVSEDSSSSDSNNGSQTRTISGKTTLSNGNVCIDLNGNEVCDVNEPTTLSSEDGSYSFEDVSVEDYTAIIATDGYNFILSKNNLNRLKYFASYQASEIITNVNTMTSLIYADAKSTGDYTASKAQYASKYDIAVEDITADPIEIAGREPKLLQIIHAAEQKKFDDAKAEANAKASQRFLSSFDFFNNNDNNDTNSSSTVNENEVDTAIEDGSYLDFDVDTFLALLDEYFQAIKEYFNSIYSDYFSDANITDSNVSVDRAGLNGVWYITDDNSSDATCSEIDALDNITIYTADTLDNPDSYTVEYDDKTTTMDIIYGYSTVESFAITRFSGNDFGANYSNGSISAMREETLNVCKERL